MRREMVVTCEDAAAALPALAGPEPDAEVDEPVRRHVSTCLRCQAELAHYRRILRNLRALRDDTVPPPAGALPDALGALDAKPGGRRPVYVGGVVATAGAAAGVAGMLVWRNRRRALAG